MLHQASPLTPRKLPDLGAIVCGERHSVQRGAFGKDGLYLFQRFKPGEQRLVLLRGALALVDLGLDRGKVGEGQFDLDNSKVIERVLRAGHVVAGCTLGEGTEDEHDGIDFADVGQEFVAKAFALACSLDEAADIDKLAGGVHDLLGLRHLRQQQQALVRHRRPADVGLFGRKWVRRSQRPTARKRVEQRGLACVGETDEPEAFHET